MPDAAFPVAFPSPLARAGLDPATLARIDHLAVGCGGFARELLTFTGGASSVKDRASGQRLSAADAIVDQLLREQLCQIVPHSTGFSEEGGSFGDPGDGLRVHWLIDPIDGTRPALLGGAFGISIGALVLDGESPVAAVGWVYIPTLSALYRGIVAPGYHQCLLNDRPVHAPAISAEKDLLTRYCSVGSDWQSDFLKPCPMKLAASGATAVHLTQLVHPESDIVAAALTRYHAYDVAGGLPVAVAGGCEIHPLGGAGGRLGDHTVEALRFLLALSQFPERSGPRVFVCAPGTAKVLRGEAGEPA